MLSPCLAARRITKNFSTGSIRKREKCVLSGIELLLEEGSSVGIVGKSGSGKTTLGKILAGILEPTGGQVLYEGRDIFSLNREERRNYIQNVQMMFQNPEGALNPMKRIERQFFDVCRLTGSASRAESAERTARALEQVGLSKEILCRLPSELSGGQNQRVALGRILLLDPKIIILDEPTSALDISVQAQILHLLKRLQHERRLSYIFISHDPEVVDFMCDRIVSV
ncbi:MAG: ABC transporter ATP-binding protein [Spirochaetia bacterium]